MFCAWAAPALLRTADPTDLSAERILAHCRSAIGLIRDRRYIWIVMWMAVAITAIIFAIGNILFGHFEEKTPKWRRVTKVVLVLGMVAALAARFGPAWGLFPIGLMLVAFVVFHLWWLPHRYGINGLTA